MRQLPNVFVPIIGLFVLVLTGCSDPDARYSRVEGTVTYNGQPVEAASVTFLPTGGELEPASGHTDVNGRFVLTSSRAARGGSGALPGEYTVIISKVVVSPDPDFEALKQGQITQEEYERRLSRKTPADQERLRRNHLPAKYADRDRSGLTATVVSGKNPPLNFDLTD